MRRILGQSSETKAESSELQRNLELVAIARTLQPANLPALDDARLQLAITHMRNAGVVLPSSLQGDCILRRAQMLKGELAARGRDDLPRRLDDFVQATLPWRLGGGAAQFDFLMPSASMLEDKTADIVSFF